MEMIDNTEGIFCDQKISSSLQITKQKWQTNKTTKYQTFETTEK